MTLASRSRWQVDSLMRLCLGRLTLRGSVGLDEKAVQTMGWGASIDGNERQCREPRQFPLVYKLAEESHASGIRNPQQITQP